MKKAFTMIELVFVIVVLGILAAVALPKFGPIVEDAKLAAGKSTVSSIRSAIVSERQSNLIKGTSSYPAFLDDEAAPFIEGQELFDGNGTGANDISILTYPIYAKNSGGGWMKTGVTANTATYRYIISTARDVNFTYTIANGRFDCDHTKADCKRMAE